MASAASASWDAAYTAVASFSTLAAFKSTVAFDPAFTPTAALPAACT